MRSLALTALMSLALACSGPSPAINGGGSARVASAQSTSDAPPQQPRFEEALLRLRIQRSLLEHLRTAALGVDVEVVGNAVVLSGEVAAHSDRTLAEEVALAVPGAAEAHNDLDVADGDEAADGPLTRGARAAERELADAVLELRVQTRLVRLLGEVGFRIEVEASDGVVSLSGPIPDAERKRRAQEAARAVSGVGEVHDLLKTHG